MKKLLTLLLLFTSLILFTSCGKLRYHYRYYTYPNIEQEYDRYLNISTNPFTGGLEHNRALYYLNYIKITNRAYRDMEPDSTGKLREVYRETESFKFLDPIKITYKGKSYTFKEKDFWKEYNGISLVLRKGNDFVYYDLADKNSHFTLDIGRVKLKIYNYQTKKVTEKIIKMPTLTFKMWMTEVRPQSILQQLETNSGSPNINFKYAGWVENYEGDLPLRIGDQKK